MANPQTTADLLTNTGKVFMQKSQLGGGSPMIRGFATNRVLINVDGIRMNNAIFRSGNVQNVISIDANSIQNTEVILGPGTVIYGSDAIGGVMNFYTLAPEFSSDKSQYYFGNVMSRWSSANNEKHFILI
ncbi:Plug domain-containing protein [Flavobacterium piscinae]|uniref:Plug domain-containing protein n=1 Tax=Flavobacterium piscinae TaxID=2506424 RepID=UPI002AAB81D0|nr:Plug domain-containing protein [Flavobacterium piscinae]